MTFFSTGQQTIPVRIKIPPTISYILTAPSRPAQITRRPTGKLGPSLTIYVKIMKMKKKKKKEVTTSIRRAAPWYSQLGLKRFMREQIEIHVIIEEMKSTFVRLRNWHGNMVIWGSPIIVISADWVRSNSCFQWELLLTEPI